MSDVYLRTGWTEPINDQLLAEGVAVNLTGMTVDLVAQDASGATITLQGTASIADAATGKVRFSPHAADIVSTGSPWRVWWKVTASGKVAYFPSAGPERWLIA